MHVAGCSWPDWTQQTKVQVPTLYNPSGPGKRALVPAGALVQVQVHSCQQVHWCQQVQVQVQVHRCRCTGALRHWDPHQSYLAFPFLTNSYYLTSLTNSWLCATGILTYAGKASKLARLPSAAMEQSFLKFKCLFAGLHWLQASGPHLAGTNSSLALTSPC